MTNLNTKCRLAKLLLLVSLSAIATMRGTTVALAGDSIRAVGVAKVDITPSFPIRLNGFGARRIESEGVTHPIFAKALAIGSDKDQPLVFIAVDSTGIRLSMVDEVAARLKQKAGILRERFVVTFTHTHTAPKLNGVCDTVFGTSIPPEHQAHIDRYTEEVANALEQVALEALKDRRPAKLSWAKGKVGFAANRRTAGGPVDHDLPLLVVKSLDDGAVRAIYVSYACHCVTLSDNKISGDWAGFAATAIERNHPAAIALVSIGCGSDSNPDSGVTGSNYAVAAEQGGQIAAEVERLLQGPLNQISGLAEATYSRIELPLNEIPSRADLEKLAARDDPSGYNAKFQLARLDRGETLVASIDYPVQSWTFGDALCMVFLGGEVCVDYSLRFKQEFDPALLWINGYSNEMCSYIPSERLLREGGYGGGAETIYFALPTTLRAGVEDRIVREVHRQVPERFLNKGASKKHSATQPLSPAQSLAAMHVADDLVVELMAAEPLVVDPVAIDFGPDGRLWVAEMRDYSRDVDEKFVQTGQVTVLRDSDGDESLDQSTAFADGLRFPTDVKVWRKGVIVCDAPDIVYMEDNNGDGRADIKKVLLTGFATHNAQARVNSLRWGLDGWLYGSCGLFGGHIKSFNGDELELGARDFRFQPETGKIEAVTGRTQQSLARDDWQNWFGCKNETLISHYPLADHYLARNLHVAPPPDEVFVPTGGNANQLFPLSDPMLFKESGPPGRPTSVCGLEIYRDELLGPTFRGNSFSAEPVNQLVHRLVLSPRGVTFAGERAGGESQREFLASTDQWFRPVQVRTGPDGCLWIVDMHRMVIEHPRFIPPENLRDIDVMAGHSTGRIFRVRPKQTPARHWLRLDTLNVSGLVAALDSPNGPQRDIVQQILMQTRAEEAVPLLAQLLATSRRPEVRLQTLYTLKGLGRLQSEAVVRALHDKHSGVRRHAVLLSEPFVAAHADIAAAALALVDDADPQVQMQLAYSLGEWKDPQAATALARLALEHHADPYLLSAVLSSVKLENSAAFVHCLLQRMSKERLPQPLVDAVIAVATSVGNPACIHDTFSAFSRTENSVIPRWQMEALAALLRALDDNKRRELLSSDSNRASIERLVASARDVLQDPTAEEPTIVASLRILFVATPDSDDVKPAISRMLGPQNTPAVQQAAISVIAEIKHSWAAELLLANWGSYTPAIRDRVLASLLERETMMLALLSTIKKGDVKADHLNALQRQQLLTHTNPDIRAEAKVAFTGSTDTNRNKVIESYADVQSLASNTARGRQLFGKHCSSCHKLEDQGHAVGPDLAALTRRSIMSLLESLLDPNRAIDERYQTYTAVTDEGLVHTGILVRENATSITLREQQGKERTLLRTSLAEFINSKTSLMPEGFERDLSQQDVADVLAYVAEQGEPLKQFAGNRPTVVKPGDDGVIHLPAANCEIYGRKIVFETPFQNIGFWHNESDHVAWKVNILQPGQYDVYLHWACADDSAGNAAIVEGFDTPVRTAVSSTGGYDIYVVRNIGVGSLASGISRIVVRADGAMSRHNLMDLRGLYLVPAGKPFDVKRATQIHDYDATIPRDAAAAIATLLENVTAGSPQEYERIPAIFQVALAAGHRNDVDELRNVLSLALPKPSEPLRHWQVVVLGGGIINGVSQNNIWPEQRITQVLGQDAKLRERWARLIDLATAIADDASVPVGTRYDALRVLGTARFDRIGGRLVQYLSQDAHPELQMGAVSGLADMETTAATDAIIANFNGLQPANRELAQNALLRTDQRLAALLSAIDDGKIPRANLKSVRLDDFANIQSQKLSNRAMALLSAEE